MNNYSIYYNYKENKNDLIILFKNKNYNKVIKFSNVDVYYFDEEIVSYTIHNINNIIKIYSEGIIYSPLKELIDIINIMLKKVNLATLPYKDNSGFIIGKITERNKVNIGKEIIDFNVEDKFINQYVVVALPNTFVNKDKFVSTYHLCTYKDLNIEHNDEIFIIDNECEIGKDFYLWESK